MAALPVDVARWLADAVLVLHVAIVMFAILGALAIPIGGWRKWRWVRSMPLRIAHLALVVFVALQAWLGRLCPLTVWEQMLRIRAGEATYDASFIQHWLSGLIFFDAPWWLFTAVYTAFALLVAGCWVWIAPRRQRR